MGKFSTFFKTPEIDCKEFICSTENATLDIVSDATNIAWELLPTNLFSEPNTGTGTSVQITPGSASGQGKIKYTFEMPSGEEFEVEKSFYVNEPELNASEFIFTNGIGEEFFFCTSHIDNEFDLTYFNDITDKYEVKLTNLNETQTYIQYTTTSGIGSMDLPSLQEGYYLFWARGHNTCGWGEWTETELEYADCSMMMMMMAPNPASNETEITLTNTATFSEVDVNTEWELEVYSETMLLKEKKTQLKGNKYKIKTAGWKEGVYTVRAKYKDEVLTGKLVVKR